MTSNERLSLALDVTAAIMHKADEWACGIINEQPYEYDGERVPPAKDRRYAHLMQVYASTAATAYAGITQADSLKAELVQGILDVAATVDARS